MKFMLCGFLCTSVALLSAMSRQQCPEPRSTYQHLAVKIALAKKGDTEAALFLKDAWGKANNPNYITNRVYELRRLGFLGSNFTMHPVNAHFIKAVLQQNETGWSLQNIKEVFPDTK